MSSLLRVNWGPQHPITGHLRFILDLDGDIVVNAIPEIGYTHRGIEKLAENRNYLQVVPLVERVCNIDSFNVSLGYVMAVEELMGVKVPERAQFIRTIMAELGRIMSHLYWFAIFGVAAGLFTLIMWPIADRELFIDLAEMVVGSRVTYSYFTPGGVFADLPDEFDKRAAKTLAYFERRIGEYEVIFLHNKLYQLRTMHVGVLDSRKAIELAVAGPSARGSGIRMDVRSDEPYAAYDQLDFEVPVEDSGDAYARAKIRLREMKESVLLVRQALNKLPEGPIRVRVPPILPREDAYSRVECGRGEFGIHVVGQGSDRPYRLKISTPSFRNMSALPHMLKGARLADLPIIYHSMDIWPLDVDR